MTIKDANDLMSLLLQKDGRLITAVPTSAEAAHTVDKANGKEAGATLYLTKPDGIHTIAGIVEEFLSEKRKIYDIS